MTVQCEEYGCSSVHSSMSEEYRRFVNQWPSYSETEHLDRVREEEFSRLDEQGLTYLDYTGAAVYSSKVVESHALDLLSSVYGNPHSYSAPSILSSDKIEAVRENVRKLINDYNSEYEIILTANASAAIKLVAESFPFNERSCLLLTEDNHNSVHGIRAYALAAESNVRYSSVTWPDLRIEEAELNDALARKPSGPSLFSMPAQSNVSGVRHDLSWVNAAREAGWVTLLDAAAYMPSSELDVNECPADFICISFYKMFGYPTGIGCLLARKTALQQLNRPGYSGGSVMASGVGRLFSVRAGGAEGFEDGTPAFTSVSAVTAGLEWFLRIGTLEAGKRTTALTCWLLQQMCNLAHDNGSPVTRIFGPTDMIDRGATIAFHILDPGGNIWSPGIVEEIACANKIAIRAGYHCNPGCIERINQLTEGQLDYVYDTSCSKEELMIRQNEVLIGVIRISLGIANNFYDVMQFNIFLNKFLNINESDQGGLI